MKESEQIGEIDPESTIQATGIETPIHAVSYTHLDVYKRQIHERVMPLHHHESFAFQAVHRPTLAPSNRFRGRPSAAQADTDVVTVFSGVD